MAAAAGSAENFNPRSRVGSDVQTGSLIWGLQSFQSTLPRGERRHSFHNNRPTDGNFNPRSRVGRDRGAVRAGFRGWDISFHAPAWGATSIFSPPNQLDYLFQSTLPRGERPIWLLLPRYQTSNFNPRSRVGSDSQGELSNRNVSHISIHAPAWGATAKITKSLTFK